MPVFTALPCILEECTLVDVNKVSSYKMHSDPVIAGITGMWQLGFIGNVKIYMTLRRGRRKKQKRLANQICVSNCFFPTLKKCTWSAPKREDYVTQIETKFEL